MAVATLSWELVLLRSSFLNSFLFICCSESLLPLHSSHNHPVFTEILPLFLPLPRFQPGLGIFLEFSRFSKHFSKALPSYSVIFFVFIFLLATHCELLAELFRKCAIVVLYLGFQFP